jgi:hypothetical protein
MKTYDSNTKLDRPLARTVRGPRRLDVVHAPEGTVLIERDDDGTHYETVTNGRLHRRWGDAPRSERGARIMARRWLRELQETG